MQCPVCDTELEEYSEVDFDGGIWHFAKCSLCGFEAAGIGQPLTREELEACRNLVQARKNQGGVIRGS